LTVLRPDGGRGLERRVSGFAGSPIGSQKEITLDTAHQGEETGEN